MVLCSISTVLSMSGSSLLDLSSFGESAVSLGFSIRSAISNCFMSTPSIFFLFMSLFSPFAISFSICVLRFRISFRSVLNAILSLLSIRYNLLIMFSLQGLLMSLEQKHSRSCRVAVDFHRTGHGRLAAVTGIPKLVWRSCILLVVDLYHWRTTR